MTERLLDQDARDLIRNDLDATLVVEAAAGTGKTTELVQRITQVIVRGRTTLNRIVAVTFTEKSAGEMKLRLRAELERARHDTTTTPIERERLSCALRELETAHIATIHAFCGDLLAERPIEAGIDPGFVVATQEEAEALQRSVFDAWFQRTLSDPPEGVRRVLARHNPKEPSPRQELQRATSTLIEQRDFDTAWRRDGFERESFLDRIVALLRDLAQMLPSNVRDYDALGQSLRAIGQTLQEIESREAVATRDYDTIEADLRRLLKQPIWKKTGTGKMFGEGALRSDVVAHRARVLDALTLCMQACEADLAACLHRDLQPVVQQYTAAKARTGMLDFLDLLIRVRDMLRDHAGVRDELRQRFTHVFVDEFQDTDPLQAEIMLSLAGDDAPEADDRCGCVPGKLFLVGDPKQSIYRFRRADVSLYARIKHKLQHSGAQVLQLTTSFRSLPAIQGVVNAAFSQAMIATADGSQPQYHALNAFRSHTNSGDEQQPAVIALPVPRPYGDRGSIVSYAIDASLPGAVAALIKHLIEDSNFTVHEPGKGDVRLEARHICLLFRRMRSGPKDIVRPYVHALEAHRIAHVLMGGRSFHAREEVMAIRAALHAIEWPDDELHVYATLRGPLFALSDEQLLIYKQHERRLHPLSKQRTDDAAVSAALSEVAEALAILGKLHVARNRRPAADTLARLLQYTRAHAGFAVWPAGEQALANVLRVLDEARRFEARGTTSFRAFVEYLAEQAEESVMGEAPVVEEATDGVRMMTVHNAKGLEFPVVILCDPTAQRGTKFPSRYIDHSRRLWTCALAGCVPAELREQEATILRHENEESIRLAYVAATRARDLLVVPVVGDKPIEGWLDMLNPALYPSPEKRRDPRPAPRCPPFGDDSVLEASFDARRQTSDSVKPGLHVPAAGDHTVVWWDPAALMLDPHEPVGLRQQELLQADAEKTRSRQGIARYEQWQSDHVALIEAGVRPSVVAQTITAIAHDDAKPRPAPSTVTIERTSAVTQGRPSGRRFGTLVHAVLAERLMSHALSVEALCRSQGRWLLATDDEVNAAIHAVNVAWDHDVLVRARKSRDCRVEVGLSLALEDGSLAEGVADLAFLETIDTERRWVIVDFKTDDPTGNVAYATQVDLYAQAITRATGIAAISILLAV